MSKAKATFSGTGVRINCISPGQIDVGVDLKDIDMRGMASQLPPASLQTKEVRIDFTSGRRTACISFNPLRLRILMSYYYGHLSIHGPMFTCCHLNCQNLTLCDERLNTAHQPFGLYHDSFPL